MRVLVLGVTGMLGSAVYKTLSNSADIETWGTCRDSKKASLITSSIPSNIISGIDVLDSDSLVSVFSKVKPDVVINCIGLIKQLSDADNPLVALPINSLLPHRIAQLCELSRCRLIHISTDCVFSGRKGNYSEGDISDAEDLYGKSKCIGEVATRSNAITLRTSIIGHELQSTFALLEWFLNEQGSVKGFSNAIFSGLPTDELSRIIRDHVIPNSNLSGLYHVSSKPISKFDLLNIIAKAYEKNIEIIDEPSFVIDRSLRSDKFCNETGYQAPSWPVLIDNMRQFHVGKFKA